MTLVPGISDRFKRKVHKALQAVRRCLDDTRHPCFPSDIPHAYEDKYLLAEYSVNTTLSAQLNVLEALGLDASKLHQVQTLVESGKTITLRFDAIEKCNFLRETERKESGPEQVTTSRKGTSTHKVVTTIKEFWYSFEIEHSLILYAGSDPNDLIKLSGRKGSVELMCTTKKAPHPETRVLPPIEVDITWIFKQLQSDVLLSFSIDRDDKECRTPRRNPQVIEAVSLSESIVSFSQQVNSYITRSMFSLSPCNGQPRIDTSAATRHENVFVPVLPLLEERQSEASQNSSHDADTSAVVVADAEKEAHLIRPSDTVALLDEQRRSLAEVCKAIADTFPPDSSNSIPSYTEGKTTLLLNHLIDLCDRLTECVDCIEHMLYTQLVQAIGKEVSPADFDAYMEYHQNLIFAPEFAPRPFCHAIRRPAHYPEGLIAIENRAASREPIRTMCRTIQDANPVTVQLSAATSVQLTGPQYLHGYVANAFADRQQSDLVLSARARQFSCFMLVIGKMLPGGSIDPEHAIIVQNKDDLLIPLVIEQLPTPKAFRDAIESLSDEQKRFAKAYRAMQLSGTVFGVAVIQLKPQLEELLALPSGSLTKEIALTQGLLSLFIEHQIPSDLLRFDGDADCSQREKLDAVRKHVAAIDEMLQAERQEELALRRAEEEFEHPNLAANAEEVMRGGFAFGAAPRTTAVFGNPGGMMPFGGGAPPAPAPTMKKKKAAFSRTRSAGVERMTGAPPPPPEAVMECAAAPPPPKGAPVSEGSSDGVVAKGESKVSERKEQFSQNTPMSSGFDFTTIPAELDRRFEKFDPDAALHASTIKAGSSWTWKQNRKLLGKPAQRILHAKDQKEEKNSAFDLLDALSRSGTLAISCSELHVILAATHCFDKTVTDTVVVDNINPIEKVERSALILGSTIHDVEPHMMVKSQELARLQQYSAPALLASHQE